MSADNQIESVREIGYAIAVAVFVAAISTLLPVIGFFSSILLPLPVLYFRLKLGKKPGIIVFAITSAVVVLFFSGVSVNTLIVVGLLLLGLLMGEGVGKNLPLEKVVGYSTGIVIAALFLVLLFYANINQTGLVPMISAYIGKNLDIMVDLYREMGVQEDRIRILIDAKDQVQTYLVRLIPGMTASTILLIAWATILFARPLCKARNVFFSDYGSLNLWKPPEFLVWLVIAFAVFLILPDKKLKFFGLNGIMVMMVVYFFEGIAIVSYVFEKKEFPKILRVILYWLIVFQQILLFVVIAIGFFDTWFNFRKIGKSYTNNNEVK